MYRLVLVIIGSMWGVMSELGLFKTNMYYYFAWLLLLFLFSLSPNMIIRSDVGNDEWDEWE